MSGNINAIVEYVYDDLGNQTILYDDNADGKADFVEYKNELDNVELHDIRPKFQKFTDFLKDIVGKERFEK